MRRSWSEGWEAEGLGKSTQAGAGAGDESVPGSRRGGGEERDRAAQEVRGWPAGHTWHVDSQLSIRLSKSRCR